MNAELKTREANIQEETKAPNRGFASIFIKLIRYYPHGNVKKVRSYTHEGEEGNQTVIIKLLCVSKYSRGASGVCDQCTTVYWNQVEGNFLQVI